MTQEIMDKLKEHDENFKVVFQRLDEHAKKLDEHTEQLDTIARVVFEHSDRLDRIERTMATKDDIRGITETLDVLVKFAKKNDQEITFMGERLTRVEKDVQKMKPLLGLV